VVNSTFKEVTTNTMRQRGASDNLTANEDRRSETELWIINLPRELKKGMRGKRL